MAGVHIPITERMVRAGRDKLRALTGRNGAGDAAVVLEVLKAALAAGEISMGNEPAPEQTVKLTFTNHYGEIESVRLPVGAAFPYDFGPRGLAFRKVQVTR